MVDEQATTGELLRHVYEELSRGDPAPLIRALAEDVSWTIIGSTPLSGTYQGKQAVMEGLFGGLRERLATPVVFTIHRVIEDAQYAVLVASGEAISITGRPYNNSYCIVAHVVDGRLVEMTDYIDTDLIMRALFDRA
jgi:ketosteroid isomerase-like protein